jgi:preprotein translocase subunit Sss1
MPAHLGFDFVGTIGMGLDLMHTYMNAALEMWVNGNAG